MDNLQKYHGWQVPVGSPLGFHQDRQFKRSWLEHPPWIDDRKMLKASHMGDFPLPSLIIGYTLQDTKNGIRCWDIDNTYLWCMYGICV